MIHPFARVSEADRRFVETQQQSPKPANPFAP